MFIPCCRMLCRLALVLWQYNVRQRWLLLIALQEVCTLHMGLHLNIVLCGCGSSPYTHLSPELARSLRLPRSLLLLLVADLLRSLLLCLGERHLARSLLRLRCALLPSLLAPSRVLPCCLSRSADALLGDALRLA